MILVYAKQDATALAAAIVSAKYKNVSPLLMLMLGLFELLGYHVSMISINRLETATPEVAEHLGRIMPFLSAHHDGSPVNLDYLRHTVESPSSVQLIAAIDEPELLSNLELAKAYPVIGAATLSTLHGALGEKAWLEDFVVAAEARKLGVAQKLWDAMTQWRVEKGLYQMRFNSTADRKSAHGFYFKNGCQALAEGKTTLFVHKIDS